MGWEYGWKSRKELIAYLCNEQPRSRTLARKATSERGQPVLWTVQEISPENKESPAYRLIVCYLIGYDRPSGLYGYRELGETDGPYYYSCPLSFLDMAPEPEGENVKEWRENVRRFHAEMAENALCESHDGALQRAGKRDEPQSGTSHGRTAQDGAGVVCMSASTTQASILPIPELAATDGRADSLNNRALSLMDSAKPEVAEELWEEALQKEPHHLDATYNLGLLRWRTGRITDVELLRDLQEAGAGAGDVARLAVMRARVLLETDDCEAAVSSLEALGAAAFRQDVSILLAEARRRLRNSRRCLRTFEGHTEPVSSVSLSADGRLALSGSHDKTLKLWDTATGDCLRTFEGNTNIVHTACLSADGRLALSCSYGDYTRDERSDTLKVWEVSTGHCLNTIDEPLMSLHCACLSADGRLMLSASDRTLKLWELSSAKCLRTFEGHRSFVRSLALSADGRLALSGSEDTTLRLWEESSGKCLRIFEGNKGPVSAVALSADARVALSDSCDPTLGVASQLKVWDIETGKCLRTLSGHAESVLSVSLSGDGGFALSGSLDQTLKLWDVATGKCLRTLKSHTSRVNSVFLSGDGRFALSGSSDNTLKLWEVAGNADPFPAPWERSQSVNGAAAASASASYKQHLEEGKQAHARGDAVSALGAFEEARRQPGFQKDSEVLDEYAKLYPLLRHSRFAEGWEVRTFEVETYGVTSACLSADGRFAVPVGIWQSTLNLWEVATGKCLRTFKGHTEHVSSAFLSADGLFALSGSYDKTLKLWEVATGNCLRTFVGHTSIVHAVCLSADGHFALSGSGDTTLKLWDVETEKCLRTFEGHTSLVVSVCLSTDGRFALSGSADNTLRLWDVAAGKCLHTFEAHTQPVASVNLSVDGRFALSGSHDKTLKLWEAGIGKCLRTFEGHTGKVNSVCLSADGRFALSGSADTTMKLWEAATGKCLRTFEGHAPGMYEYGVTSVCLSADGRLALSSADKVLKVWFLDWELSAQTTQGRSEVA